jgi:hypothetical protein
MLCAYIALLRVCIVIFAICLAEYLAVANITYHMYTCIQKNTVIIGYLYVQKPIIKNS